MRFGCFSEGTVFSLFVVDSFDRWRGREGLHTMLERGWGFGTLLYENENVIKRYTVALRFAGVEVVKVRATHIERVV